MDFPISATTRRGHAAGGVASNTRIVAPEPARSLARREAVAEAGDERAVGSTIAVHDDGDAVVTVRFAASIDGYRGWEWSVTMALVDPVRPTVSEVVLLPGPDALTAPEWVPWRRRVRSGDLGPGDILPLSDDDDRVVPAYLQSDDPAVEAVAHELGIGRLRVLSRVGRADAAKRWHRGETGPHDETARRAPGPCATCAFYLPVAGSLGAGFGVCANELSSADGRVVDADFGCGAHSEAAVTARTPPSSEALVDELALEWHPHAATGKAGGAEETATSGDRLAHDAAGYDAVPPATGHR